MACSRRPVISLRFVRAILFFVCSASVCLATRAEADGIRAFMDFSFGSSEITSTDPTGVSAKSKSDSFAQRYNVSLERALYPSLIFSAGVVADNVVSHSEGGNTTTTSTLTSISPYAGVSLTNQFFPTSFVYNRREEKTEANGVAFPTRILESYNARTSLKPEGLPPVDFSYARTHAFDEQRLQQDLTTDTFQWGSGYTPTSKVSLGYQGAFTSSANAISHLDTEFLSNNGRIGYGDRFFQDRVNFSTNYNLATSTSRVSSSGGQGNVFLPQVPLNGTLSATTSPTSVPPLTVTTGQLTPNPSLSVGSANINLVAVTSPPVGTQIEVGFDFGFGSTVSVNTVYLTVISGTNQRPVNLGQIPTLNQLFAWSVYTSTDGITWTPSTVAVTQQFGADPTGGSDTVGFILNLASPVTSRFVKAVITPVPVANLFQFSSIQGIDINSIAVARLQAFSRQPASSFAGGGTSTVSGQLGLNATAKLLDNPLLTYDMGFGLSHNSGSQLPLTISWFLSNALSLDHRFNQVFSGNARISLQQQKNALSSLTSDFGYSVGLNIVPLPTLTHNISYSGTVSRLGDPNSTTASAFFITNSAQLYKGVGLTASGGYSTSSGQGGQKNDSVIFNTGLSLIPRKDLTVNLSYSEASTKQSGGAQASLTTFSRTGSASAAYTPFNALYFTGSWSITAQNDQPTSTTQNYAMSWSPFRGGALLFNFSYNESLSTPDNQKTRSVSPTVRWNIRPGTTLDLSYQYFSISSPAAGVTEGSSLASTLRIAI